MSESLIGPTKEMTEIVVLKKMLGIVERHEERFAAVDNRLITLEQKVEEELTVTSHQALAIRNAVAARVRAECSSPEDYKERRGKLYSAIYHGMFSKFNISQYRELPRVKIDLAIKYIREEWKPLNLAA